MTRPASLGMYDAPALVAANDTLWSAIAARLRGAGVAGVPERLDRTRDLDAIWSDPGLLLAQSCGYPFATRFRGRLRYVATPVYRAPGCDGATHRSRIVVRRTDAAETVSALRARRVAVNDPGSNTGMNLLRAAIAPFAIDGRFFDAIVATGSHVASARAVADGAADVAAIDAVSFAHLERAEPKVTARLRTLAWSVASPGLPLVTSAATSDRDLRALRSAIRDAVRDVAAREAIAALLIEDVETLRARRYDVLRTLERRSVRSGYPGIA